MAEFDLSALDDVINRLDDLNADAQHALADTLNYGAELAMDAAEEMISSELNIKHDYIRGKIAISKRATERELSTTVRAKRRGLLLSRFDAQQKTVAGKRAGISLKVKSRDSRKTMRSAFFIKLKKGKLANARTMGVAIRPTDDMRLNRRERLEVSKRGYAVLHGPSVSQAVETMSDHIDIDNQALINYFLNRIKK